MRSIALLAAVVGALGVSLPAQASAGISIDFSANSTALPGYTTAQVFQSFDTNPALGLNGSTPFVGTSMAGITQTSSSGVNIYANSVDGQAIGPLTTGGGSATATGNFLAIQNGSYTIAFDGAGIHFLSFLLGGLDSYNSVTLNYVGGGSDTLGGQQIIGSLTNSGPTNSGETGRVNYNFTGAALQSVVFSSTQKAFEIDEIASAAPEPASWGMMILGFGLAGGALRIRRRADKLAQA